MQVTRIELPDDFEYELWEDKGYFPDADVWIDGRRFRINFYSPGRLAHDIEALLRSDCAFAEENLVVVARVTRESLVKAVDWLSRGGRASMLRESPS